MRFEYADNNSLTYSKDQVGMPGARVDVVQIQDVCSHMIIVQAVSYFAVIFWAIFCNP